MKKTVFFRLTLLALIVRVCLVFVLSCQSNEPDIPYSGNGAVSVTGVSLSVETLTLEEGQSTSLTAKIIPENATNKTVNWSSADTGIATVIDGNVTAVKAGSTTISVKTADGGKTATCSLTVTGKNAPSETVGADHISAVSVVLSGKANLGNSVSSDITMGIIWSTNAGVLPSNSTKVEATNMDANYNYSVVLTSLVPEATYYFRSYVSQNGQDTYGETKSFTTKSLSSLLTTQDATDIKPTTVKLNGTTDLSDVRFAYKSIEYGFQHGLSEAIMSDQNTGGTIVDNVYSVSLTRLSEGTQYWYKAYIKLDGKYYFGNLKNILLISRKLRRDCLPSSWRI